MADSLFYFFILLVAAAGVQAVVIDRKRKKGKPAPTREEKWLSVQSSIGAMLIVISSVIGGVPLVFAVMFLHASDSGANNHRDSAIVIAVVGGLFVLGLALYLGAHRKLRRLRPLSRSDSLGDAA